MLSVTALVSAFTGAVCAQDTPGNAPREITNSAGMKLVLVPAGEFLMGSPEGEKDHNADEWPRHKVTITKAFYMGAMEVTQAQWTDIMGRNSSFLKGDTLPVDQVTWEAVQDFLKKLSKKEGKEYRLPTEAEWEYACRAGSTTRYYFGDDEAKLGDYATYKDQLHGKARPVGEKKPNAWGLYDMHGNVWEWCQDWYGPYAKDAVVDPTGPAQGVVRVLRGGSAGATPLVCRSALRGGLVVEGLRRG